MSLLEKEKKAIERLKSFEPIEDGYYLAYSGGKDSDVIKILAQLANVKFKAVHNLTTVDAPETVQYIKSQSDVHVEKPQKSMWQLIEERLLPPTRIIRYCCSELKERGGQGQVVVTGVRWAESGNRKESADVVKILGKPKTTQKLAKQIGAEYTVTRQGGIVLNDDNDINRRMVEHCYRTQKTMVNPIVDWLDKDVWDFLEYYGCKSNPLYECGYKRVGCIGCPMASKQRYIGFLRYPKYKENYIRAFERMIANRIKQGKETTWETGEDVFRWWLEEDWTQLRFEDLERE